MLETSSGRGGAQGTMPEPAGPGLQPRVARLQAAAAEDFDGLVRHLAFIQERQISRLQSLSDLVEGDGSCGMSGRERPNTTKLPEEDGPGFSSHDGESRQVIGANNDGGNLAQGQIIDSVCATHTLDRRITMDSIFTQFSGQGDNIPTTCGSSSKDRMEHCVTSSKKAATLALGRTHGLLHIHMPADGLVGSGLLGRVQRFYLKWVEVWKDEPEREGCLARFVDGRMTYMCMVVILVNAVVMGVVANEEMANPKHELSQVFETLEHMFIVSYLLEQILKLTVHRLYHLLGLGAKWNWFDILVLTSSIMSLAPESKGVGLTPLRSLRVLKVAKFLRLLRVFRILTPLRHMLTALMASAVPLFWSLTMLAFLMFMFVLFFLQVCSDRLADSDVLPGSPLWIQLQTDFGSLGTAMYTLFAALTGGDWTKQYANMREVSHVACVGFLFYIAFFNVAVLNIVTGMFVNAAMKLAQPDLDEQAQDKLRDHVTNIEELRAIANELDVDGNGFINPDELRHFVRNPSARARLAVLGVDATNADSFVKLLSATSDGGPIPVNAFVNSCCRLAGHASSVDLQYHAFQMALLLQRQNQLMSMVRGASERVGPKSQNENGRIGGSGQVHPTPGGQDEHQTRQDRQDRCVRRARASLLSL